MEQMAQPAADAEELRRRLQELETERRALETERRALEIALANATLNPGSAPCSGDVVALSVGGQRFVTTRETLLSVPGTYFDAFLSGRFGPPRMDTGGALFIDRDAASFAMLLEWLRGGAIPEGREARIALWDAAGFFTVRPLVELLEDLLDGRAHIAACVAVALQGASLAEETAARVYFGGLHRNPTNPPLPPSPHPDSLLLRPLTVKAHAATFVDASDDADTPPVILAQHRRALVPGRSSIVHSKGAFESQLRLFTRGALQGFDWTGVLLAGGACLGPLLPLPPALAAGYGDGNHMDEQERWETTRYYNGGSLDVDEPGDLDLCPYEEDDDEHTLRSRFSGGDIDLFLYGLTDEQAFAKVAEISEALHVNGEVSLIVRTANTITFQRKWPNRHVQIILYMYHSPADVLCSFDIDCCACGYDGSDVLVLPRARLAINRALNVTDPSRVSPTYDTRLWKYAQRGFGVAVPAYTGSVERTEIAKPRFEASPLARLVQLDHQNSKHLGKGFYCGKFVRYETADVEQWLQQQAAATDPVASDAYGGRVLLSYWPHQWWGGCNKIQFESLLKKLLFLSPPRYMTYHTQPFKLREPAPTLPWLFSDDVSVVLDARNQEPLVAFKYDWHETIPPDPESHTHDKAVDEAEVIVHNVSVPYNTSLPLLCTFAVPPQLRLLSGSFHASPVIDDDDDGGRAFYRGMTPQTFKQRRQVRTRTDDMVE